MSLIWMVPAISLLAVVARPFFTFWAGTEFGRESPVPFYILLIGLAFNIPAYLAYTGLVAAGRTDVFATVYWAELPGYIILVWILSSRFGAVGASIAWSIRVIIDSVIMFKFAKRHTGIIYKHRRSWVFGAAAGVLLTASLSSIYLNRLGPAEIILVFAGIMIYGLIIFKTVLDVEEASWLASWIIGRRQRIQT